MATIRPRTLPSGKKVWLCDYSDMAGKRRAKQFQRKKDADAFLVKARGQIQAGIYVHDADSITITQAAGQWLDHIDVRVKSGRQMERATAADYRAKTNLHILDPEIGLGSTKLSALTRRQVNEFVDQLHANGRETPTVRKVLGKLKLLLSWALDNGLIMQNVAAGVRVLSTTRTKAPLVIPTRKEIKALIDNAGDEFKPILLTSIFAGLRSSEARGLLWTDVDLSGGFINVSRRVDRYGDVGEPKSAAGSRSIPIGPSLVSTLRHWKLRCPKSELGLVFASKAGTHINHSNLQSYHFRPLCTKAGVKTNWHALRHFCISSWIAEGLSVKSIMTWAGHSSVAMTMDLYGHLLPSPDHHVAVAAMETKVLA